MIERLVEELKSRFPLIHAIQVELLEQPVPSLLWGRAVAEKADEDGESSKEDEDASKETVQEEVADQETAADAQSKSPSWRAYRLVLRLSDYDLVQNTAILEEIAKATLGQRVWIEPLFLTTYESDELGALGQDADARMLRALEALREKGLSHARRYLVAAMDEILRVLWLLEQEFTTTGLHTWLAARKLELLFIQLVRWAFAMEGRVFHADGAGWEAFQEELCGEGKLFSAAFAAYPLQIRAFVNRHNELSTVISQSYGENDLEIDQLMFPLQKAAEAVKERAAHTLVDGSERVAKERRRRLLWAGVGVVLLAAVFVGFWFSRPPSFRAVARPTGGRIGGIVGRYYTGQNFDRFVKQRADYELNFSTDGVLMNGLPKDHFSARWEGYLEASEAGVHEFCVRVDDGARVFLHQKLMINEWRVGAARTRCRKVYLQKGWHPLRIEYFERGWMSVLRFLWKTPRGKQRVLVPSRNLCCR
ncbi:MAG: hypothetical protein H6728_04585 [Myxococcales bacterium]|nr:hypothetical protein [Myxococcales bacterium]MCB9642330.1 hypothetical protein [Myxococcales bacterium]